MKFVFSIISVGLVLATATTGFASVHFCDKGASQVTLLKDGQGQIWMTDRSGNITPILQSRGLERLSKNVEYLACFNGSTGQLYRIQDGRLE